MQKSKGKKKARPTKATPVKSTHRTPAAAKPMTKDPMKEHTNTSESIGEGRPAKPTPDRGPRYQALHRMLMTKRHETMSEIEGVLGRSLTEDQQRRLEAAMDVGDQSLMDLERELGISLMEMRNRKRQLIDEALRRLDEGTYGMCEDCGVEISEKRLAAVPFAKFCVECQAREELMEKIVRGEERD